MDGGLILGSTRRGAAIGRDDQMNDADDEQDDGSARGEIYTDVATLMLTVPLTPAAARRRRRRCLHHLEHSSASSSAESQKSAVKAKAASES